MSLLKKNQDETKQCPHCKETINKEAVKCKHCGSDVRGFASKHPIFTVVVGFIGFMLILSAFNSSGNSTPVDTNSPEYNKTWAAACAKVQVENMLKAPSTADFPWVSNDVSYESSSNTYKVSSYVDAENSFGAKIRSYYKCTVSNVSKEKQTCSAVCSFN